MLDLRFVPATADDVPEVLAVLDRAAARLSAAGIRQWPERFAAEAGGDRTLVSRYELAL
ncbi:hypothetical protein KZZ52_24450 [Dactylosporangium sp. AC04546]|uniref:hypothetical protein n=1 Tax=Dactylosporangium sp. AC04546 TaxID=2862460 RepID=UPI001EDF814A|nr:hypothetical protein [Dactylosporangium sp. AC04546]WVK88426.1 hypothetical protein KZZ52_24450 [Dactylosporangium sp. AC04546]